MGKFVTKTQEFTNSGNTVIDYLSNKTVWTIPVAVSVVSKVLGAAWIPSLGIIPVGLGVEYLANKIFVKMLWKQ